MDQNLIYAAVLGYVCGAIPFGLLITRLSGLGDIRSIGSGNFGATNVLRTGRKSLAAATLLLDVLKAALPALVARYYWGDLAAIIAGTAAFFGHLYPIWLRFKGGKGVATLIGALLALSFPVGLIFCAVWAFIAFVRRISSLAALTAATTAPVFAFVIAGPQLAGATALMSLFLIYRHSANIKRLLEGTESKIGGDKTGPSQNRAKSGQSDVR